MRAKGAGQLMLALLALLALFAVLASADEVQTGVILFAVGIVVGLVCVLVADRLVRNRLERDYKAWIAAGRPERRIGERRGTAYRRRRR